MEFDKLISDMKFGDEVQGFYILKDAVLRTASTGKPFLTGAISDRSGTLDFKVWDYSGPVSAASIGKVVKVRGDLGEYKGSLQMNVSNIREAYPADDYDRKRLVPTAPIDVEERINEIRSLIDSVDDPDYRFVAQTMLERHLEKFSQIPAAKSVHHSFVSGLLMHTSNMLRIADFLAEQYPDVIDRSLLLTGTLLHDFSKENEFTFSGFGLVTDYSEKGQLLGHLVMGAEEIGEVCADLAIPEEKSLLLRHMVLSHHGEPEYGAAVKPLTAEAELLYLIDCIDSKMEIFAEVLPTLEAGQFSERIFALDRKIYKHRG